MKKNNDSYNWKYCSIGGATRIAITTGSDIEHLGELDEKLWTVLSMPVNGLEFDAKTLTGKYLNVPTRTEIPENINEQLIVDLYSK